MQPSVTSHRPNLRLYPFYLNFVSVFSVSYQLVGGIDKRTLAKGKDAIKEELDQRLPLVADGGFLPSVDHSVPPDISFKNYLSYLDLYQEGCQRHLAQI